MKTIEFKGEHYPHFQAEGFAAQFAFPFAAQFCKGIGVDIGCNRKEWAFPGAIPVDIVFQNEMDAMNIPVNLDYIFSSHCLEHLPDWVEALNYWIRQLKSGGILFLYLPDMRDQVYWRPWHNRKHIHYFTPQIFVQYFEDLFPNANWYITDDSDLNSSFTVVFEKP